MSKRNPLIGLIGKWQGDKGLDLAPKPDVDESNPYYETLIFEAVDIDIENAGEQELTAIRYHQEVREKANDEVSHSETGYWIWNNNDDSIICAFSIPRGVSLLAGGNYKKTSDGGIVFNVLARVDDPHYGIVQSPFMMKKAKTTSFKREFKLKGDALTYVQESALEIYDKKFNHTDERELVKDYVPIRVLYYGL